MNEKEIAELRRRFKPEKNSITHIHGCYVGEQREIISQFDQSLGLIPQGEAERLLALLKKSMSGALGKNLLDIGFTTMQVADSEEHRALMALRESKLADGELLKAFYQRIMETLELEGHYLILMAYDSYDVPYRSKDGEDQADGGSDVFSYFVCAICPVKPTKPALSYFVRENAFHTLEPDWVVANPELGFLFPAFDDRSANLYNALYYVRDAAAVHQELVDEIFRTQPIMPAPEQKETFQTLLGDTLEDDCNFEVVQAVNDQLRDMIQEHKDSKTPEPLTLSKGAVKSVLKSCGVQQHHVDAFDREYDQSFGPDQAIAPRNVVDVNQVEIKTPDVVIKVDPQKSDLVETRIIDGRKYILIRADEGVEVSGVNVKI
jgi:hypothetical protein